MVIVALVKIHGELKHGYLEFELNYSPERKGEPNEMVGPHVRTKPCHKTCQKISKNIKLQ